MISEETSDAMKRTPSFDTPSPWTSNAVMRRPAGRLLGRPAGAGVELAIAVAASRRKARLRASALNWAGAVVSIRFVAIIAAAGTLRSPMGGRSRLI
jgi:hypothetical protein